jgi:hypothetical protein
MPQWVADHEDFFFISDDMDELKEQREDLARYFRVRSMDPPVLPLLASLGKEEAMAAASWQWEQNAQPASPASSSLTFDDSGSGL